MKRHGITGVHSHARLVQFALDIPDDQRKRGRFTKVILREALGDDLPEAVRSRRTKGAGGRTPVAARAAKGTQGWEGWDKYAPFYDWENAQTVARRDVAFWQRLAAMDSPSLTNGLRCSAQPCTPSIRAACA